LIIQTDTIYQIYDSSAVETIISSVDSNSDSSLIIDTIKDVDSAFLHQPVQFKRFVTTSLDLTGEMKPKLLTENHSTWIMGILAVCLFIIAFIRFTQKQIYQNLFQFIRISVWRKQPARISEFMPRGYRLIFFVMIAVAFSVLAIVIINKFSIQPFTNFEDPTEFYATLIGLVFGYMFLKLFLVKLSGIIFKATEISKEYSSNILTTNTIAATLLVPVLMLSQYDRSMTSTYLAILLCIFLFIFRAIRGIFITLEERKYSLYHFFIYFCTLEILPVLIIIKTILFVNKL